jgi:hypothetical protein
MRSDENQTLSESRPPDRGRNHSLYFFEKAGEKYYFRLTRLGLFLLILLIAIPITALLLLFTLSRREQPSVNTNITLPLATPYSANTPVIRQAPPPSPAKAVKQPSIPLPPTVGTPGSNTNQRSAPKQSPQPLPSESPP